jgi:hypothetical protein
MWDCYWAWYLSKAGSITGQVLTQKVKKVCDWLRGVLCLQGRLLGPWKLGHNPVGMSGAFICN